MYSCKTYRAFCWAFQINNHVPKMQEAKGVPVLLCLRFFFIPDLATERLRKGLLSFLLLMGLLFTCTSAFASYSENEPAATTIIAKGEVSAFDAEQNTRAIKRREVVYDVDTIITDVNSKAQFRFTDGGLLAMKEDSRLLISSYCYNEGAENNEVSMALLKGGLRSITGAIKANEGTYELKVPMGSIGIRGTHFELELVEDELYVAVWDGAIDVYLTPASAPSFSLGRGEKFSFGFVNSSGVFKGLMRPPSNFRQGHSSRVPFSNTTFGETTTEQHSENNSANTRADDKKSPEQIQSGASLTQLMDAEFNHELDNLDGKLDVVSSTSQVINRPPRVAKKSVQQELIQTTLSKIIESQ